MSPSSRRRYSARTKESSGDLEAFTIQIGLRHPGYWSAILARGRLGKGNWMANEQLLTIIISLGGLILTSTVALVGLILAQSRATRRDGSEQLSTLRSDLHETRSELHSGLREAARERAAFRDRMDSQIGDLRQHVDHQIGDLRDRMGRIEGTLTVLRDCFVHKGRGTAA